MVNPGPDEQSRGNEYPPLVDSPTAGDAHEPVDYPADPDATPAHPQQPDYPQPGYPTGEYPRGDYSQPAYQQPDSQQGGYQQPEYQQPGYPQGGNPPPPPGYPPQYPGGQNYGYHPSGDPYANQYANPYAPVRPVGTNGKAIVALVTSLAGLTLCGLPSIIGVIFGILALREIKQTGQDGHGLALAGVIIGAIVTVFAVIGIIFYVIMIAAAVSSQDYSSF